MIKIIIKGLDKVKIKAKGVPSWVAREVAFGAAACVNEVSNSSEEFVKIKNMVISELERFEISEDGEEFVRR